jgi:hypothetical protein
MVEESFALARKSDNTTDSAAVLPAAYLFLALSFLG